MMRRLRSLAFAIGIPIAPAIARADWHMIADPYDVPEAPRAPTLPELTHPEIEATLEATAGAILNPGSPIGHAYVQRLAAEVPVGLRRWFVGAEYELAAAGGDMGTRTISGNVELEGRTLWATPTGLGYGGGLGLMLPTASAGPYDGTPDGRVAMQAVTLRPWDVGFFSAGALDWRPFVDVRALDGPFVAQFRQGLDIFMPTSSPTAKSVYATAGVYFGFRATPVLAVGLEAFEAYAINVPDVRDGSRASVIVSPSVRLALPWVEPAISAFTNLSTPLEGPNARVWGFRFTFTLVYDRGAALGVRPQMR